MNFEDTVPSLEYIALVGTAASLWNQREVRTVLKEEFYPKLPRWKEMVHYLAGTSCRIMEPLYHECRDLATEWGMLDDCLTEEIAQLRIPLFMKENLTSILKPVGQKLLRWILFHYYLFEVRLPDRLRWSPQGIVDEAATARSLVDDEQNVDVTRRYQIACVFCFEDKIRELWGKMSKEEREKIYDEEIYNPRGLIRQRELVKFWTDALNTIPEEWERMVAGRTGLEFPHGPTLEFAVLTRNMAALRCFLQKLTPGEKERALIECLNHVLRRGFEEELPFCGWDPDPQRMQPHVLKFLFSQIDLLQIIMALLDDPVDSDRALRSFLQWPWQDYFMRVAELAWGALDGSFKLDILCEIVDKIRKVQDYDYKKLFLEFWRRIPTKRDVLVEDDEYGFLLSRLLRTGDRELVRLYLDDAPAQHTRSILLSYTVGWDCISRCNNGDLLKFFLGECLPDEGSLLQLKAQYEMRRDLKEHFKRRVMTTVDELLKNRTIKNC